MRLFLSSILASVALLISVPTFAQGFSIEFGSDGIRIERGDDDRIEWDNRCNQRRFYFNNRAFCDEQARRHVPPVREGWNRNCVRDADFYFDHKRFCDSRNLSPRWDDRCNNKYFYDDYTRWCERQLNFRSGPRQMPSWDFRCNNRDFYNDYTRWCERQR